MTKTLMTQMSDISSIASKSSNTHIEDVTKSINFIDLTDIDKIGGNK